jgi:hypothetical protein
MSGQPYKYSKDPDMYRQRYMDTLSLTANINDMNLQANKVYKATGQLPPQSSMPDNRTTSEKLGDIEKMKVTLIGTLKPIMDSQMAQSVLQGIQNSPYNADGSLFNFFAQRAKYLVEQLTKIYTFGIKGDENDVAKFIAYVVEAYSKNKSIGDTSKSIFDQQTGRSFVGGMDDVQKLVEIYKQLIAELSAVAQNKQGDIGIINDIRDKMKKYSDLVMGTTLYRFGTVNVDGGIEYQDVSSNPKEFMNFITSIVSENPLNEAIYGSYMLYIDTLKEYPKPENFTAFINQLRSAKVNQNNGLINQILINLDSLIPDVDILKQIIENINKSYDFAFNARNQRLLETSKELLNRPIKKFKPQADIYTQREKDDMNAFSADLSARFEVLTEQHNRIEELEKDFAPVLSHIDDYALSSREYEKFRNLEQRFITKSDRQAEIWELLTKHYNKTALLSEENKSSLEAEFDRIYKSFIAKAPIINDLASSKLKDRSFEFGKPRFKDFRLPGETYEEDEDEEDEDEQPRYAGGRRGILQATAVQQMEDRGGQGNGVRRRRGRPKGRGISVPFKDKVDFSQGIAPSPRWVKLGKHVVNTNKLNDNIMSIKTISGSNIAGYPSYKMSPNLTKVIKHIVGGGLPSFEDMSNLTPEERKYLYNVSKKSDIIDKINIPAPSRDQQEKDNHQFEVMKGEIMSGNDSKELVKKFKVLILKMSKTGELPKSQVADLLTDLAELGY